MKTLTLKNRRFLVVWICINAFALFVNVAHIQGEIKSYSGTTCKIDLLTDGHGVSEDYSLFHPETFYPFTTEYTATCYASSSYFENHVYNYDVPNNSFKGIFNGYSYWEFIVYTLLGFAIVFIPKVWGKNEQEEVDEEEVEEEQKTTNK